MDMIDYTTVTEISGESVSKEQVKRMCNRYIWASQYVKDKDVLEVACGAGQGLKYLASYAKKVVAGDICEPLVKTAAQHAGQNIEVKLLDAENLPFPTQSFDVIILFEALYYLPHPAQFIKECQRLLRPNGKLLISTANKDLFDFNPSPYSHQYFGVIELKNLLETHHFNANFFGDTPLAKVSLRQKLLRPIKKIVVAFNLMPKTMAGKKLLKKLVFGAAVPMPASISTDMEHESPTPIADYSANTTHKVIFCEATLI